MHLVVAEGLKDFSRKIVNVDAFISEIEEWIQEKLHVLPSGRTKFTPPFQVDQLRLLDYALEGVSFQQLLRMPVTQSGTTSPGECLFLSCLRRWRTRISL
jgi:hypothetical protein